MLPRTKTKNLNRIEKKVSNLYILHKSGIINLCHFLAGIKKLTLGTIRKIETGNTVTKGRVDMNTDTSRLL